jgi:DNA repair protein RecO
MNKYGFQTQGLILQKFPYRERDLIVKTLSPKGQLMNVVFYGGKGGGTKKKSSLVELGHCLNLQMNRKKLNDDKMLVAKEWALHWNPQKIRENHQAYYLMNFYFEMILKLNIESDEQYESDEHKELYILLSNALFYLEKDLTAETFSLFDHLNVFLAKFINYLGILPDLSDCLYCGKKLEHTYVIDSANGGFNCCLSEKPKKEDLDVSKRVREVLAHVLINKYEDAISMNKQDSQVANVLFHYFCYQFHLTPQSFKSASLIF